MERVVAILFLCLALLAASISLCAGYDNTVTVSAIGGDFTTVSAALASITDAGENNRYLIKVFPGTYGGQVICKPYVDIVGESRNSVIITGPGNGQWPGAEMIVRDHVYIADLTLRATGAGGTAFWADYCGDSMFVNCTIEATSFGGYVNGFGSPETPDRESNIDRWMTLKNCSVKAKGQILHMSDNSAAENCVFTVNHGDAMEGGAAFELGGNATMRDCFINVTLTGVISGEYDVFQHSDYAYPTRIERSSINCRVTNASSTAVVRGIRNGNLGDPISGAIDVDHCTFQIINNGSGATYDIWNGFNDPGWEWSGVYVCASKYNPDRTFGFVFPASQGDIEVRNIEVTGDLTVTGNTTIVLPDKDRTRLLPVFVMGTVDTPKGVFGNAFGSPTIGYQFPDDVTITKLVAVATVPGGLWPDPAGQVYLIKNGQQAGSAIEFGNDTAEAKVIKCEVAINEPFTPQDKMSLFLEPFYSYDDVSVIIEYTVD